MKTFKQELKDQAQKDFEKYCRETKIPKAFLLCLFIMLLIGGGLYLYECYTAGAL